MERAPGTPDQGSGRQGPVQRNVGGGGSICDLQGVTSQTQMWSSVGERAGRRTRVVGGGGDKHAREVASPFALGKHEGFWGWGGWIFLSGVGQDLIRGWGNHFQW